MIKKNISFTDYNGNQRSEDFYFNLTKAEIAEMELSTVGGLTQMLRGMIAAQDMPAIVKFVKELILKSYGKKSPDGKRFIKSEELSEEFMQTEAYSQLFMELATDADATAKFVNGILPEDVRRQAEAEMKKQQEQEKLGEAN